MEPDLALTLGVVITAFSVPGILSALSDRRAPRASSLTILIGGALILFAITTQPGGYQLKDVPDVFMRTLGQFV